MTQHRVPSCGRHLGKFDDVTIYPVLVVARTDRVMPTILYWDIEVEGGLVFRLNISYICALLVSDEFHFHVFLLNEMLMIDCLARNIT